MSTPLVPDDLWEAIEPLLPNEPPKPKGGRPRGPDRAALAGIVFVLRTGCPWRLLPKNLGCCSGCSTWRAHSCACAFFPQRLGESTRSARIGLVAALTGITR